MSPQHTLTVADLLADALIQKVMLADQVDPETLRTMLNGVADRVGARRGVAFVRSGKTERRPTPRAPAALLPAPQPARLRDNACGLAASC